jgi:homospermidine synthase
MPNDKKARFDKRLVMLGFGSIGQAVLPLLFKHLGIEARQIEIIKPSSRGLAIAEQFGVAHTEAKLTEENYQELLASRLNEGDFLVNLSVDVCTKDLISLCQSQGALYVDASTEPWGGTFENNDTPPAARTNYSFRKEVLSLRAGAVDQPTALITLGANPGMVSFLVKQALLDLAGNPRAVPRSRQEWATLAQDLGVRVIHISERDTQVDERRKAQDEFVNTWSVKGFVRLSRPSWAGERTSGISRSTGRATPRVAARPST